MRFEELDDWKQYKLKEISKIYDGTHQTPDYKEEGISFVSVEDIGDLYATTKFITKEAFVKDFKVYPKKNDILMTRIGDIGTPALVTKEKPLAYYVSLALIKPTNNIDSTFAKYMIQSNYFQHELWKRTIHVAFPKKINKEEIGECLCFVPNKTTQQRIGLFLLLIDKRIEVQSKIIEKYESLMNSINNSFFKNIKTKIQFKDAYLRAGEGGTPDTKNSSYYIDGNVPFIKIDDLNKKFIKNSKTYITEFGLKKSSAWIVPPNSVLLSNGATIGETSINLIPVATKQGILGIVPNAKYKSEFLYYIFKSSYFKKELKRITTKGTMDAAYLKDINKMKIPYLEIEMQEHHNKIMNCFENKIDSEKKLLQLYSKEKVYLLNNLFI